MVETSHEKSRGRLQFIGWSEPERATEGLHENMQAFWIFTETAWVKLWGEKPEEIRTQTGTRLRRSNFFRIALLAKLLEKLLLAERVSAVKQVEQKIFRLPGLLSITVVAVVDCGQGFWVNE